MRCCVKAALEEEVSDDSDDETVMTFKTFKERFSHKANLYNRFHDNLDLLAGKSKIPLKNPEREKILFSTTAELISVKNGKTQKKKNKYFICVTTESLYVLRKIIRLKKYRIPLTEYIILILSKWSNRNL